MVFTVDLTKGNEIHESPKKVCGLRSISNKIKCPFGGRLQSNSLQNLMKNPSWPDSNFLLRTPVHSNFHVRLLGHGGASAPGFHFFPWLQHCFCSWSLKTRSALRHSGRFRFPSSCYSNAARDSLRLLREDLLVHKPPPMIPSWKTLQWQSSRHHKGREAEAWILRSEEVWRSHPHQGPAMSFSVPVPLTMEERRVSSPSVSGDTVQRHQPGGGGIPYFLHSPLNVIPGYLIQDLAGSQVVGFQANDLGYSVKELRTWEGPFQRRSFTTSYPTRGISDPLFPNTPLRCEMNKL